MNQESAAKRIKINDEEPASVAAQPSVTTTELPGDPKTWTIDQIYQWAVDIVKIDPEDAQKLKSQKITGHSLSEMTYEKFVSYGIPGGPASSLVKEIRTLFPSMTASHGSSRSFTFFELIICGVCLMFVTMLRNSDLRW